VTDDQPLFGNPRLGTALLVLVALALLATTIVPLGPISGSSARALGRSSLDLPLSSRAADLGDAASASSIGELGPVPSEVTVGVPVAFAWQALDAAGARATTFAVGCDLTVTESTNASNVRAWANASTTGPLVRSPNGTFSVPSDAWNGGVFDLTVSIASAVPVTLRLFGPLLPALPAAPVTLAVLPDLDHLVLYGPTTNLSGARASDTFWHVRDRFGDPTPGAFLIVEYSTGTSVSQTFVPVTWTTGGTTGAWVNYSAPDPGSGTVVVMDESRTTLLGPVPVPALATTAPSPTPSLSPFVLVAVALLAVGAVVGMVTIVTGGRARLSPERTEAEEELRRLAEGREAVVDLVRRAGPLALPEIEDAWEPPPAPPALADWVASLVTDGTLTVTLGEGGRARFTVADRPSREPKVTLDEEALERGLARRDAAVEDDHDDARAP
jgi:hypothetical protein